MYGREAEGRPRYHGDSTAENWPNLDADETGGVAEVAVAEERRRILCSTGLIRGEGPRRSAVGKLRIVEKMSRGWEDVVECGGHHLGFVG